MAATNAAAPAGLAGPRTGGRRTTGAPTAGDAPAEGPPTDPPHRPRGAPEVRRIRRELDRLNRSWSDWPGSIVRAPRLSEPHFLQHRRLALALALALDCHLPGATDLLVVDIGAGKKPYHPLLASRARNHVGVDLPGTAGSEVFGASETLPIQTDAVDVVLSTQMLEHADDPEGVLREWRRVLRPGGLIFASTHGTAYYHPIPVDHWRWTHSGLRKLFERSGFRVRSIEATTGTLTTLATILNTHVASVAGRLGVGPLGAAAIAVTNLIVGALERVDTAPLRQESEIGWGAMPWTYLVVAEKCATATDEPDGRSGR